MEEYLEKLIKYLPIEFSNKEEKFFIKHLSEAYLENFDKKKYQFSFISFHLLNMVFIYKVKWFLKKQNNTDMEKRLDKYIKEKCKVRGLEFNTLFDLSNIPEKESFGMLLRTLKFHSNEIKTCLFNVDVRDNCAHASGKIYYKTSEKISNFIKEELEFIEKIHERLKEDFRKFLETFLEKNFEKNIIPKGILNLFNENYLSFKDLELISELNLSLFNEKSNNEKTIRKKILYLLLIFKIQNLIESEKNLFIEKLPIIMIDLPEKIIVKRDGDGKEIYTSEIIEPFLMSIIGEFSDEDKIKAQKILGLI